MTSNELTQDSARKSRETTCAVESAHVPIVEEESKVPLTFEDIFFKLMFFSGSQDLTDPSLISILTLDRKGLRVEEVDGITYVFPKHTILNRTREQIKQARQGHKRNSKEYRSCTRALDELNESYSEDSFSYSRFYKRYNLSFDKIASTFPIKFRSWRLVLHSLKAAYALLSTLKMFEFHGHLNQLVRITSGRRYYKFKKSNLLSNLFLYIYRGLERKVGVSPELESTWIKVLKTSLCTFVSKTMNQEELPEGDSINLFHPSIWSWFSQLPTADKVRFAFSCLQSKSLFQEVPQEFVQTVLVKHRNQLTSSHRGISPEFLKKLRERGQEFGRRVAKYYKPNKSRPASNKATAFYTRDRGGVKGDLVAHDRLEVRLNTLPVIDPQDRPEPFVIGFFGQPGQGKSTKLNELVHKLKVFFPQVPFKDLVYQRTCNTKHWDGYRQQPIVILDDLGQAMSGEDIQEFQTLVSCNPYIPPMAGLNEKGMYFASPIIITTSNLSYGCSMKHIYKPNSPIIDDASFWRRFHLPIYVEKKDSVSVYHTLNEPVDFKRKDLSLYQQTTRKIRGSHHVVNSYVGHLSHVIGSHSETNSLVNLTLKEEGYQKNCDWCILPFKGILNRAVDVYRVRLSYSDNFSNYWYQNVFGEHTDFLTRLGSLANSHPGLFQGLYHDFQSMTTHKEFQVDGIQGEARYKYPAFPPEDPLPVRVVPIKEPLKVRTITAGIGDTFCLKPFQTAMWHALGEYPQFTLTHGTDRLVPAIDRIYNASDPHDVWISGDYTAATDSFAIEASLALLEGILESIDHLPTKRWAMKEISPHLLIYPKDSGLSPVLQESGQLMGSLLSFPLLCLLNDCTASFCGVDPSKYLINGDDILIRASPAIYPEWKNCVREVGLDLSLGKNYIHKNFGTVNSQLILDGEVLPSGKQTVLSRSGKVLGQCLRDLEIFMETSESKSIKNLFKEFNRPLLSRTIRSIHVPSSHGGLGFSWNRDGLVNSKDVHSAVLCYFHDLESRIKPISGFIRIPYLSVFKIAENLELQGKIQTFEQVETSKEFIEDFLRPSDIATVEKKLRRDRGLKEMLFSRSLEELPPLNFIHTIDIPVSGKDFIKPIQEKINEIFTFKLLGGDYHHVSLTRCIVNLS